MKKLDKLTNIIEAILLISGNAVSIKDIAEKLEIDEKYIVHSVKKLQEKYGEDSGIQLLYFNKKLQFSSNSQYAEEVSTVLNPIKERELSRSLLETAAIIAYKQPVTRIDLEQIRGNSEYAVQKLLELKIIEPVGRKDAVGKPILYATTDEFLKRFQISSLDELPDYEELLDRIATIRGNKVEEDYLYHKDEYVEEGIVDSVTEEVAITEATKESDSDFELPPIEDEEVPDFLKGEKVERI